MPSYQITGPNGKKYRITGESPEGAMAALRAMLDTQEAAPGQGHANVPEYVPPGVDNYDPETGLATRNSKANSALWGAMNTAGSGFGDELSAGLISGIESLPGRSGKSYDEVLGDLRRMEESAKNDNPWSYTGGQVGGGLAVAGATGGAGIMSNASSLLGRIAGGMMTGGLYGGLHGAGSGEDLKSRVMGGVKEGVTGLAVGGLLPLLAAGASSAYSGVMDHVLGSRAAKEVATTPEALRMIGNAMEADGTRGGSGAANIAAAGKDAMLADAGRNTRAILDTSIQRGGKGAVAAREAVEDRTTRASQAVTEAFDNALGLPQGVETARRAIRTSSQAARSGGYKAAYGSPIDYAAPEGQVLERMIKNRVPGRVIAEANELMRINGEESAQILAKIADDGAVVFERLPDVRQIDYITRALRQVADSSEGTGALGGQTPKGSAYQNLAKEIRDKLKGLVPEYATALETAADPISRSKAVEFGAKLLSPSTTRDQVDEFVHGITGPEREALAQGIRSRLDDVMANVTRTVQDGDVPAREAIKALKDMSSRASRQKIAAAIGEERAAPLFKQLDEAAQSFDLRAAVADNSKTYARLATDRRINEITKPGAMGTLLQGHPLDAGRRAIQTATGQTPEKIALRQDELYSELARLLTRPGGGQDLLDAIVKIGRSDQATRLMTDRIDRALSGPHLAYPTTTLLGERLRQ